MCSDLWETHVSVDLNKRGPILTIPHTTAWMTLATCIEVSCILSWFLCLSLYFLSSYNFMRNRLEVVIGAFE